MPLGIDFTQILLHLFNVLLLFVGLYIILYKPVKKFIQCREDHYKKMDEEANAKLAEADAKLAEYTERISDCDNEISKKKKQADKDLELIREQAEDDAKKMAAKIISDAKKDAENQKMNIIAQAKNDITKMVEDAASKVVLTENTSEAYDLFLDDAERSAD